MQVANRSRGDEQVNGLRLYGLDAEVHRNIERKRDRELERQLAQWVAAAAKEKVDLEDPIASLRSGILLCKLANAIQPDIIRKYNTRPIALLEMENIGFYLKACWKLGVASAELFVTSDLYLRKSEAQVFVNLLSLARIAESTSSYKGPTMKSLGFKALGRPPAEKRTTQWSNVIQDQGTVYITDIEKQEQEQEQRRQGQEQRSPRNKAGGQPAVTAKPLPTKPAATNKAAAPPVPRGGDGQTPSPVSPRQSQQQQQQPSPRPSPELEAVKILERQLDDERKRSVAAVNEIRRLQKDLDDAKIQLESEKKRLASPSPSDGGKDKEKEDDRTRGRAGTVVDTQALYEKIKTLELKKEKELEEASRNFEARLQEERHKWEEESERARTDLMNDIQYWKTEAESKDQRLNAQQRDAGKTEEWEQRTAERRKREMELAQRKEAAAKALLEREKKKAEQDKAEIERLKTLLSTLTQENEELRQANASLSRSVKAQPSERPAAQSQPEAKHEKPVSQELDEGIFDRLRKNTIVNAKASDASAGPASPRNQITTLRWATKQEEDDELVAALNECVHAVLYSSTEVHFSDIMKLNEIFKTDYGRRQFAFALKQTVKKLPSLCLSSDAFDMMLYLMTRMLVEAESSGDKDYIALGSLMRAASSLYRMDRRRQSYLQEFIKDFSIWKNGDFWEEYFLHEMIKKQKKEGHESKEPRSGEADDAKLASSLLPHFASHMIKWDIPLEVGEESVRSIAERFSLPESTVKETLDALAAGPALKKAEEEKAAALAAEGEKQAFVPKVTEVAVSEKPKKKTRTKKSPKVEEKPSGVIKSFQPPPTMIEKEKRIEEVRKKKKAEEKKSRKSTIADGDEKKKKKKKEKTAVAGKEDEAKEEKEKKKKKKSSSKKPDESKEKSPSKTKKTKEKGETEKKKTKEKKEAKSDKVGEGEKTKRVRSKTDASAVVPAKKGDKLSPRRKTARHSTEAAAGNGDTSPLFFGRS